jgi:hypothetical protein
MPAGRLLGAQGDRSRRSNRRAGESASTFTARGRASSTWPSKCRRFRSTISCSPSAARKRAAGQPSLSAVAATPAQHHLDTGQPRLAQHSSMRAASILSVAFMLLLPRSWRSGRRRAREGNVTTPMGQAAPFGTMASSTSQPRSARAGEAEAKGRR